MQENLGLIISTKEKKVECDCEGLCVLVSKKVWFLTCEVGRPPYVDLILRRNLKVCVEEHVRWLWNCVHRINGGRWFR